MTDPSHCICGIAYCRPGNLCSGCKPPVAPPPSSPEPRLQDPTNPGHYTSHPSGVECIQVTEHMNFNLGNAVKYIWRAGLKSPDALTDLRKARWYLDRELARLESK